MVFDLATPDTTSAATTSGGAPEAAALAERFRSVRRCTQSLAEPLAAEDYVLQSMPDASPVKWHLAHSTWFFETFVLKPHLPGYRSFQAEFEFLFNSYYNAVGARWPRARRGLLSRPTVHEIGRYRRYVDEHVHELLRPERGNLLGTVAAVIEIGLQHEQQHQELILTDLKHALSLNPLHPVYRSAAPGRGRPTPELEWLRFAEGLTWIGHKGPGFAYDNESPRHRVFLEAYRFCHRLVRNADYLLFIEDGGYRRAELWLSDGWATCQARGWEAPLYWEKVHGHWQLFTLSGMRPLDLEEPVCHVSYYEADAFARWSGARLPTEAEWEHAAAAVPQAGHFLDSERFHPAAGPATDDRASPAELFGSLWQWTASPYVAYPGYQPLPGALGEYNGKFMCNQFVLRGASCATPRSHARLTYRNFFPPDARWQFTGIRLAGDLR